MSTNYIVRIITTTEHDTETTYRGPCSYERAIDLATETDYGSGNYNPNVETYIEILEGG